VAEIVAAGHMLANHSHTHPDLAVLPRARVEQEIMRAGDAIEQAGGRRPELFRAPGGAWSATVLSLCAREGLRPLAWSVDPRDWSRPGARQIAGIILRQTRPGSIILEHDGGGDRRETYQALSAAIPLLQEAGYTFTTP
jgi:peptidoglycan/xylan/chitin deacetylase (PgdA/CDA1 family)